MNTLTEIFDKEGSDKGSFFCHVGTTDNIAHNYTPTYEEYMEPYRDSNINILEIGLASPFFPGASLRAWYSYFSKAKIFGLDVIDCTKFQNDRVKTFIVDQTSEWQLSNFAKLAPKFQFIIDDGCHDEKAITISLSMLFPLLESGGTYFIEDLHVVNKERLFGLVDRNFQSPFINTNYINEHIDKAEFTEDHKMCMITKR